MREVLEHYESQTEEEAVAEDEAAFRRRDQTVMVVPKGLVPAITNLVARDLRHTCLTNLAMAGVPINGIKEYAGHASIVETQKYLKFMPQSIDLAASVSTRLAALAKVGNGSNNGHKTKSFGRPTPKLCDLVLTGRADSKC